MHSLLINRNQFALDVLNANKQRFTEKEFRTLKRIAEIGQFDYRKNYEAADELLPYLPSFNQAVADKLAAIGLEISSIPANDGTGRKLYALVAAQGRGSRYRSRSAQGSHQENAGGLRLWSV